MPLVSEHAHHMALLPLFWLTLLAMDGKWPGAAWWWMAGAFAVSWLADTAAHFFDPLIASAVYPIGQAAILGAVLLTRRDAELFVVVLSVIGLVSIFTGGVTRHELFLRTVAWGSIVGIIWTHPLPRLRLALLVAFGGGWLAWIGYTVEPGWTSWSLYQGVRFLGLVFFCWAATNPKPRLQVAI